MGDISFSLKNIYSFHNFLKFVNSKWLPTTHDFCLSKRGQRFSVKQKKNNNVGPKISQLSAKQRSLYIRNIKCMVDNSIITVTRHHKRYIPVAPDPSSY